MKLAAPVLSQTVVSHTQNNGSRVLVICTATGITYLELPAASFLQAEPGSTDERVIHNVSAEHCLLCSLSHAAVLPTSNDEVSWRELRAASHHYTVPLAAVSTNQWEWPSAIPRAPPVV